MKYNLSKALMTLAALCMFSGVVSISHAAGKTYTENEFLDSFSGKTKKTVTEKLGAPFKKEYSVKPTGASTMLAKAGASEKNSKPVKVEMWYYKNIVSYAPKKMYKETEITFVNDKAMNIAFFNNR